VFVVVVSAGFGFLFSVVAKRLAGKSISNIAYFVSSGTLNIHSINQSVLNGLHRPSSLL